MINKIILGDCLEEMKLLEDNSIDCIYTDIPYLYNHSGVGKSEIAKIINKTKKKNLENLNIVNGINIDDVFPEWLRLMKKVNLFIWCSKLQILDIMNYINNWSKQNNKTIYTETLVWVKTNPTPSCNNVWLPDVEYCLYFREKGIKLNDGYFHKQKAYISGINVKNKYIYEHPTIKPLECVKKHLLHATQPNDVVLDTYIGSGTTAVACKELGRNFVGIELDEDYYNIAIDRINKTISLTKRGLLDF